MKNKLSRKQLRKLIMTEIRRLSESVSLEPPEGWEATSQSPIQHDAPFGAGGTYQRIKELPPSPEEEFEPGQASWYIFEEPPQQKWSGHPSVYTAHTKSGVYMGDHEVRSDEDFNALLAQGYELKFVDAIGQPKYSDWW